MSLHSELIKEKACSEDLNSIIFMHIHEGRYDLAEQRTADLMKSIQRMQHLQKRIYERKRLHEISLGLAKRGLIGKVVSLYEETAR